MNRKLNNKLNIIKPDADRSEVNNPRNSRSFEIDKEVWVWNFNLGEKWIPSSTLTITDPVLCKVLKEIGLLRKQCWPFKKEEACWSTPKKWLWHHLKTLWIKKWTDLRVVNVYPCQNKVIPRFPIRKYTPKYHIH